FKRVAQLKSGAGHPLAQRLTVNELVRDEVYAFDLSNLVNSDYVRVIEGGGRMRLLYKTPDPAFIRGEMRGEQLERDLASETRILREVNLPHPARSEDGENLVVADLPCDHRLRLFSHAQLGGDFQGGRFNKMFCPRVTVDQRFDFASKRLIAGAGFHKKSSALLRVAFQSGVINASNHPPTLRLLLFWFHRSPPISCKSQDLASRQSRRMVWGETFSTLAVPSTLSPPKKRNSTTR